MPRVRKPRPRPRYPVKVNIDPEMLVTTKEAGEMLGLKERQIRYRVRWGQLPAEYIVCYIRDENNKIIRPYRKYVINKKAVMVFDYMRRVHNRFVIKQKKSDISHE